MSPNISTLGDQVGIKWFDYQWAFLTDAAHLPPDQRKVCLYYRTGAGKTITALAAIKLWGHDVAVVIAPPSTHPAWEDWGQNFGIDVTVMSHAKFRMKTTKMKRDVPVIADEFHLFGGHGASGFTKLDRLAQGLQAPLVLASATPNYNDAERCYCIQHVIAPETCRGGYLEFLYQNCNTRQNPYGMTPLVDEDAPFKQHVDAADYLASLARVWHLPDDLQYSITDHTIGILLPMAFTTFGLDGRRGRIIASQIEEKHAIVNHVLLESKTELRDKVLNWLIILMNASPSPVLVFVNHSSIAKVVDQALARAGYKVALVTGQTSKKKKGERIAAFNAGELDVLVGTASLATGTDGMDKVCHTLLILDDTEDDSLRRQLIGRIMPRGANADASMKQIHRLVW